MASTREQDGRGPTDRTLLIVGIAVLAVLVVITVTLLAKATGRLDSFVRIVANLVNVGDGLPKKSDVKYHGVLVGTVEDVTPAAHGEPNFVNINLDPHYAQSIPATVTARVVPSNVFAVSSVQLVDNGPGPAITGGTHIKEDTELPTVLFQTTISKLRDILAATGRGREDRTIGVLAAVNAATENRRTELLNSAAQLDRLVDELDQIVATDADSTTVSALLAAAEGLQQTAPDLVDALHQAVQPMQTLVEQDAQLTAMINGGVNTVGTTYTAFNNHTDQLIRVTSDLTPVLGELANSAHNFVPAFTKLSQLEQKFFDEVWIPELDTPNMRINLSFTPTYAYTRADCPQYSGLKGPSCFTAPLIPVRTELPSVLLPQNYQPPKDLLPPPGTVLGPSGNLVAVGPPLINPNPNLADPNPPVPWWLSPQPPVPGTANPALMPPAPQPPVPGSPPAPVAPKPGDPPPAPPAAPPPDAPVPPGPPPAPPGSPLLPAEAAPMSFGGNVGPVGSDQERVQLSVITGQPATSATQLLLGPVARGTTVSLAAPAAGGPR